MMNPVKLKIHLFGEFHLLANDKPVPGLNADRPQSLLAYLLLHRHAPQSRQHLAFLLWPDSTEGQARTNLRNLLYTVRHTLPDADVFLLADNMTVQWNPAASIALDVADFEQALQKAKNAAGDTAKKDALEAAVALYNGDLLPGNYDDWLIVMREDLRQQYLHALSRLVTLSESMADYHSAVHFCRRLWQQDALDEPTAVQLMRLLSRSGDRAGVQRVYQALTLSLSRELDVEPSVVTREAYSSFLQVESTQALPLIAVAVKDWRPCPLPVPATPFIGREKELADIAERLAEPSCRLLTVVGLSGMGKTRLVLQSAGGHQAVFDDGVAFASLTSLQSAENLVPLIADTLKLTLSEVQDSWTQINSFLSKKQMLLVLDNVDHLFFGRQEKDSVLIQQWLVDLLQIAPQIKLLVTSRQSLGLVGEWVYEIGGLALADTAEDGDRVDNSAITLFVNSARRVDQQFELTDEDLAHIIEICHLVDGMPLGIELAASWVRLLSCAEIVQEITRNINFLRTELRNVPQRHRSMCAIFDHSWEMLSCSEQQALARLSEFCGTFSREEAERAAQADLLTLSGLVHKSLLHRVGNGRFKLHNLVRQYAAMRLSEMSEEHFQPTAPSINGNSLSRPKIASGI